MDRQRWRLGLTGLALALLLPLCACAQVSPADEFDAVLAEANARHEAVKKPAEDELAAYTEGRTPDARRFAAFIPGAKLLTDIPAVDAIADAEDFFDLLRAGYGGYTYFGGDAVFMPLQEAVVEELRALERLSDASFAEILIRNLSPVIVDRHFSVHGHWFSVNADFYCSKAAGFTKDDGGFRNVKTGKRVEAVEGYELNTVFRLHINDAGEFVWNPVILVRNENGAGIKNITLIYEDGERETLALYRLAGSYTEDSASLDRSSGYPVVKITRMGFDATEAGNTAREFLNYAKELHNEPVVIVDIRGNLGGNGTLPLKWLHMLTGEVVPTNYVGLRAMPYKAYTSIEEAEALKKSDYYVPREDSALYCPMAAYGEGYTKLFDTPDSFTAREQLLILLVDRSTASAAEGFADACFNVENTLIVGTATGGVLNFDLTHPFLALPRSGLPFGFGATMFVHPKGQLEEGVGIVPDLWVAGDALGATVAMLNRAGFGGR